MPRRRKHEEQHAPANESDQAKIEPPAEEIPAALDTDVIEPTDESAINQTPLLAAIVHHGGGDATVNKAFLAEGIGSRLILDIEHTEDAYILRTRIAAPTDEA